jgi:hypothetical protein
LGLSIDHFGSNVGKNDPVAIIFAQFGEVVVPMRPYSKCISNERADNRTRCAICNIHRLTSFLFSRGRISNSSTNSIGDENQE